MRLLLGLLILMLFGFLGMYLDVHKEIKDPILYWFIGSFGTLISIFIISKI